jgi:hypothetical protein
VKNQYKWLRRYTHAAFNGAVVMIDASLSKNGHREKALAEWIADARFHVMEGRRIKRKVVGLFRDHLRGQIE